MRSFRSETGRRPTCGSPPPVSSPACGGGEEGSMSLGRAVATVGSFTLLSRVAGFVRDIVLSAVLGSGAVADAFFVAFKLPNFFRRLFAEGAFSAAFVPLFSRELQDNGRAEAIAFARQAHAALLLVLVPFSAVLIVAMPLVAGFAGARHARRCADLRHGRRVRPHRLPLSALHLARLALWRRAEQHRPFRPCRGHAHPAQPDADRRRAGAHALPAQRRLRRVDRRGGRGAAAMAVAAGGLRPP